MKLKELENIHSNKLCFVIGAGPSLRYVNFDKIEKFITIAVNSAILKSNNFKYFVSDDWAVSNYNYFQDLKDINCINLLFRDKLKGRVSHLDKEKVVWYDHKCWFDPGAGKRYPEGLVLTKEADKPIIGARTSTGSAIHLAYIMGCNPIVLLGNDCCFENGRRYFWQFPGEKKASKVSGGIQPWLPNRGKIKNKCVDKNSVDFLEYFEVLSKQTKKQGINIINASGGILDCFPRMSLEEVLEKYGDRI